MMRAVLELPPRDCWRMRVSFDSRYGTWVDFLSVSEVITLPKVVRDKLIIFASSRVCPTAWVFSIFSEPARSTKYS